MEQESWDLILEGNDKAFKILYNKYADMLFGYGMRVCSDREVVEEALQEVFIRIFERRHHISKPDSMSAYLCRALKNCIIRMESRKRFKQVSWDDVTEKQFGEFELHLDPNHILEMVEDEQYRQKVLQKILDSLDGRQKEIIYLRYYKGMSVQEVAEIMGLKDENIYNFTSRVIRQLKERKDWESAFALTILFLYNG